MRPRGMTKLFDKWTELATEIIQLSGAKTESDKRAFATAVVAMETFNERHPEVFVQLRQQQEVASAVDITAVVPPPS